MKSEVIAMRELGTLLHEAVRQRKAKYMRIELTGDSWCLTKSGRPEEDLFDATLEQVIERLKEWAKPPKPEFTTITVPTSDAEAIVRANEGFPYTGRMKVCVDAMVKALKENGVIS